MIAGRINKKSPYTVASSHAGLVAKQLSCVYTNIKSLNWNTNRQEEQIALLAENKKQLQLRLWERRYSIYDLAVTSFREYVFQSEFSAKLARARIVPSNGEWKTCLDARKDIAKELSRIYLNYINNKKVNSADNVYALIMRGVENYLVVRMGGGKKARFVQKLKKNQQAIELESAAIFNAGNSVVSNNKAFYQLITEYFPLASLYDQDDRQQLVCAFSGGVAMSTKLSAVAKVYEKHYRKYQAKQCISEIMNAMPLSSDESPCDTKKQMKKVVDSLKIKLERGSRGHIIDFLSSYIDCGVVKGYSPQLIQELNACLAKRTGSRFYRTMDWTLGAVNDRFSELGSDYNDDCLYDVQRFPLLRVLWRIQNNSEQPCDLHGERLIASSLISLKLAGYLMDDALVNVFTKILVLADGILVPPAHRKVNYNIRSMACQLKSFKAGMNALTDSNLNTVTDVIHQLISGSAKSWLFTPVTVSRHIAEKLGCFKCGDFPDSDNVKSIFDKIQTIDSGMKSLQDDIFEKRKKIASLNQVEKGLQQVLVRQVFIALGHYLNKTKKSRSGYWFEFWKHHGQRGKKRAEGLVLKLAAAKDFDSARSILIDYFNSLPVMRNQSFATHLLEELWAESGLLHLIVQAKLTVDKNPDFVVESIKRQTSGRYLRANNSAEEIDKYLESMQNDGGLQDDTAALIAVKAPATKREAQRNLSSPVGFFKELFTRSNAIRRNASDDAVKTLSAISPQNTSSLRVDRFYSS